MAGFMCGIGSIYYIREDGIIQIFTTQCEIKNIIPAQESLIFMPEFDYDIEEDDFEEEVYEEI